MRDELTSAALRPLILRLVGCACVCAVFAPSCSDDGSVGDGGAGSGDGAAIIGAQTCNEAPLVSLDGGKATVQGSTEGARDELKQLRCGRLVTLNAPQRYFKFNARKDRAYRLTLRSSFSAYLFAFTAEAGCSFDAIEKACSSGGTTGMVMYEATRANVARTVVYAPASAGEQIVAIDSYSASLSGSFELTIEEFSPADNARCARPKPLALSDGQVTIRANTRSATDEHSELTCEAATTQLHGGTHSDDEELLAPQLYYSFTARSGKAYRVSLTPQFGSAALYLFERAAGCTTAGIAKACSSDGVRGATTTAEAGKKATVSFRPTRPGDYVIAVDGTEPGALGPFTLALEEYTPPPIPLNAKCARAKQLTLIAGKATVNGDTTNSVDEHSTLDCGVKDADQVGPQLYYAFTARANKAYRFTVTPQFWADLYVFPQKVGCTEAAIDAACSSKGTSGLLARTGPKGTTSSFVFNPKLAGDYRFAVDSALAGEHGAFKVVLEEITPPPVPGNSKCTSPTSLTLSGGHTTVKATTIGAADEFPVTCQSVSGHHMKTYVGPQVYYSLVTKQDKAYRLTVKAAFSAALYTFPKSAGCTLAAIDSACSSDGVRGMLLAPPTTPATASSMVFAPQSSGEYLIAVDGWQSSVAGNFSLEVQEITPASNDGCSTPQTLAFTAGKASVTADTGKATDEFPELTCPAPTTTIHGLMVPTFDGPQLYYRFAAASGKGYRVELTPKYESSLYIFDDSVGCTQKAIDTSCGSAGATGDFVASATANQTTTLTFLPPNTGTYLVGVDGADVSKLGPFTLQISEFALPTPPAHARCTAPKALVFSGSVATVSETTLAAPDELATLTCGAKAPLDGRQLYYSFTAELNKTYAIELAPTFEGALYVFDESVGCTAKAIDAACGSGGTSGDILAQAIAAKATGTLTFKPSKAGSYVIAVDSYAPNQFGRFSLKVTKK